MRQMERLVFMGTPEFSLPALKRLIASEYDVMAVYTQPDKPVGRQRTPGMPPVKVLAQEYGIPILQPETLNNPSEIERMAGLAPDAVVVVAFGQILPQDLLDIPPFGCLNIHPSLLPRYRGASPVASAILSGDKETGVTIMLLDAGMDTGPILSQQRVPIEPEDTTGSLEGRMAESGADLLMRTLPQWFEHKLAPQRQVDRDASYTPLLSKEDGELKWQLPAEALEQRVRAFSPWPGCFTRWQGKILKVLAAVPLHSVGRVEPGLVMEVPDVAGVPAGVGTGTGILGLIMVQLEGRKAMPMADFLRGQKDFIGQTVG